MRIQLSRRSRFVLGLARHVALLVLSTPYVILAQDPDSIAGDTIRYRLEGMRVRASRPVTTTGGASAIEVNVDSMRLAPSAMTEELLRALPTLHLRTNSRGEAEVTVRGSESRQVAVLIDGVPLTLGWDGRTDVSVLPAGAVEDVTLVRGVSSILHGPNVLGGVVEMRVGQGRGIPRGQSLSSSIGLDHAGGYGASATAEVPFSGGGGGGVIRAGAGYRDSPGFPLPGGVSEPVPTGDRLRLNTDVTNANGFLALRYREDDDGPWGSFSATGFQAERGIAAELGVADPRLWRYPDVRRAILAISGGTGQRRTPWGRGDLEASVGLDLGRSEIRSYSTRAYDVVDGTEKGKSRTLTFRALGDHTLGSRGELRTSFTVSEIFHEATVDRVPAEYQQDLFSLAGETVWRLVDDPFAAVQSVRLSVGGAWDRGETPKAGGRESLDPIDDWGARAGLSALMNDGATTVHTGVSRRGRFPALREAYSEALDRFIPNPDLQPEHLVAWEGGVTTGWISGELQVVAFHNQLTGAIRRITRPDGMRRRVNSDERTSTGVEIVFHRSFGPLSVSGDLTLQAVELVDPVNAISTEPENMPERMARIQLAAPLLAGIRATAEVEHIGPQFCQHPDSGGDVELQGGTWLNGALSRVWSFPGGRIGRGLEARLAVTNAGDAALYDQCGLPRAGRLLQLQLRLF